MIIALISGAILSGLCAASASAQETQAQRQQQLDAIARNSPRPSGWGDDGTNYLSNAHYKALTQRLLIQSPRRFDYTAYRRFYITSRYYEPISDDLIDQMLGFAYSAQTEEDSEKATLALTQYTALLEEQLANIDVVTLGASLARDDPRFGDYKVLDRVRVGLFTNVLESGNGNTLRDAYDVVTITEETMLLDYLKTVPSRTIPAVEGHTHYNMHEIVNPETGQERTIFVNTTAPMKRLNQKKKAAARELNLRR